MPSTRHITHLVDNTLCEVYVDEFRKTPWWWVRWEDHAYRLIVRRLGRVDDFSADGAIALAEEQAATYARKHDEALEQKWAMKVPDLWELAQTAAFPRETIAATILDLRERIVRAESIDERGVGRQGLQLFAERTGISARELHRILEDRTRLKVGSPTVDKICVEFDMLIDDFIDDALAWAGQYGRWKGRPGTEDAWPIGYVIDAKEGDPII